MQVMQFPGCCGAEVIRTFPLGNPINERQKNEVETFLREHVSQGGMSLIIINRRQYEAYNELLKTYGWVLRDTSGNPNHHNSTIYLFVKRHSIPETLHPTRQNVKP